MELDGFFESDHSLSALVPQNSEVGGTREAGGKSIMGHSVVDPTSPTPYLDDVATEAQRSRNGGQDLPFADPKDVALRNPG